jgi:hypothetical protein
VVASNKIATSKPSWRNLPIRDFPNRTACL